VRFILAANRSLPIAAVANHTLMKLAALPMDAWVLLRKPVSGNPAAYETFVAQLCGDLGISVEWFAPDPEGHGRSSVYERDVRMARAADGAICYFDPDTPMDGGTGHVAERCIEEDTPVECFVWEPTVNRLDLIGSIEKNSGL
jgi:hypothetical protein